MPIQFDMAARPILYLLAIIIFWQTVKKKGDHHWRLAAIMGGLFLVSSALTFYESSVPDDQVLAFGDRTISYMLVKALLENVGLFAIVVSLLLLLTKRLDTAQREVKQLAQIAASSADAIVGCDSTGTITSWNRGAELVFDYFPEEMLGQKIARLIADECLEDFNTAVERCTGESFVRGLSCGMLGKGRRNCLAEVTISPVIDEEGRTAGTSLFVRDITEQKEMEKELLQASKMSAMGTMAAGVVQEFGNLLTVISARAQLGSTASTVPEAQEEFEAISSCAGRARSITNNLLAYARRQRPRKTLGNMSDAADAAVTLLEKELERSRVAVRRRYDPVPETAFDQEQIVHVFVNLIINALNAMREAGGCVEIAIAKRQEYIEAVIRDDGPGIPPEMMSGLFEPFAGGVEDGNRRTGLGLFVCRQIVKFHNGNITVESRRSEGTVFRIYLPITSHNDVRPGPSDTRILSAEACRVAVVDRDSMMRDLLAQALRRRSVETETFQDAESARAAGVERLYDVIFVDLSLRVAADRRYVEELKGLSGKMIIGMISEAIGADEIHRLEEGLFQTLRKPFGLDEINAICDVIRPANDAQTAPQPRAAT